MTGKAAVEPAAINAVTINAGTINTAAINTVTIHLSTASPQPPARPVAGAILKMTFRSNSVPSQRAHSNSF